MGLFRLLLAVAVLLQHVSGCKYAMTGGTTSVQTFYVVSGFFIAMILDLKYSRRDQLWLFYSNRALRIYATYWLFAAIAVLLQIAGHMAAHRSVFDLWSSNSTRLGSGGTWFLVLTNIFLFGQDLALFTTLGTHGLHWSVNFWQSSPIVPEFMLIPPAWSLSLELTFYLVAPWILRKRTAWIVALMVLSLLIRYGLWVNGLRRDPWSYRFFPSELCLFLGGALAYRLVYRNPRFENLSRPWKFFAVGLVPAVVLYPLYDRSYNLFFSGTKLLYLIYVLLAVPLIFRLTSSWSADRLLGELSYPFYLCHFGIVQGLNHASQRLGVPVRAAIAIVLSCGVAYLSVVVLDHPLDRFRQSRITRFQRSGARTSAREQLSTEPQSIEGPPISGDLAGKDGKMACGTESA